MDLRGAAPDNGPPPPRWRPHTPRCAIAIARDAPIAVMLRRGPRDHWHLMCWDLRANRVEHGQWLKGHVDLFDVSPDGRYILTFVRQYHLTARPVGSPGGRAFGPADPDASVADIYDACPERRRRSPRKGERRRGLPRYMGGGAEPPPPVEPSLSWTAIGRPPYFTALALWPAFGTWTGGAVFAPDGTVLLNERRWAMRPRVNADRPPPMRVERIEASRTGWPAPAALGPASLDREASERALARLAEGDGETEWAGALPDGSLIHATGGVVYRVPQWRDAPTLRGDEDAVLDLRPLRFRLVPPTLDAKRW